MFLRRRRRKEVNAGWIDSAQVASADREPVPVEKLENLDRDLPAIVETVAEVCGGEPTVRRGSLAPVSRVVLMMSAKSANALLSFRGP